MVIRVIESGSKGNATLIENNGHLYLIDMGITLTSLNNALNSINRNIYDIDALLLTHSHSDHTKGIKYLPPLPIYCTKDTYDGLNVNIIKPFKEFVLGELNITPIKTSHDAPNSVGFVIKNGTESLVYLTDSGYIPDKSLSYMHNATFYVIEANHNLKMLYQSNRPASLKERIASDLGHLSNEDAASYMVDLVGENTKGIILAHLSEETNTPKLAIEAFTKKFGKCYISLSNIKLCCASQNNMVTIGD